MSEIGKINGIPLFTSAQEALVWADANSVSGYHLHSLLGQVGFMGGTTHQQATEVVPVTIPTIVPVPVSLPPTPSPSVIATPTPTPTPSPTQTPSIAPTNSSSGSSGGGY